MIGDVKMQTIKRRTGRSLTGDRPLFLALPCVTVTVNIVFLQIKTEIEELFCFLIHVY